MTVNLFFWYSVFFVELNTANTSLHHSALIASFPFRSHARAVSSRISESLIPHPAPARDAFSVCNIFVFPLEQPYYLFRVNLST
jgi:hypothetical protein